MLIGETLGRFFGRENTAGLAAKAVHDDLTKIYHELGVPAPSDEEKYRAEARGRVIIGDIFPRYPRESFPDDFEEKAIPIIEARKSADQPGKIKMSSEIQ